MEFTYTINTEKTVDIDFRDIYNIQIDDFFHSRFDFDQSDIESAKDCLSDDFGDNIEYYLNRIGINDLLCEENEIVFGEIVEEYEKWLKDNFDISNFE